MLRKRTVGEQMLKREPAPLPVSYLWYSYPLMCTLGDLQSLNHGGGGGGLGGLTQHTAVFVI